MSLDKLKSAFEKIGNHKEWSIQLLRITTSKRHGTRYASRQIALFPTGKVHEFVGELSTRYITADKGQLNIFTSVCNYDGTADAMTVYRLASDNALISSEYSALIEAVANPELEADPFDFSPQAYLLRGTVRFDDADIPIKLISMQKPVTVLKHKFLRDNGTFKEISDKVLSLKPTVDVVIIDSTVYFLTLSGETLFNMERSYKAICNEKVDTIESSSILTDAAAFKTVAESGHNPRRFIAFNEDRLATLKRKDERIAMAQKFSIPLKGDVFDTSVDGVSEKIVKLLCNKGMVDPFEDAPVEVAGAKKWQ